LREEKSRAKKFTVQEFLQLPHSKFPKDPLEVERHYWERLASSSNEEPAVAYYATDLDMPSLFLPNSSLQLSKLNTILDVVIRLTLVYIFCQINKKWYIFFAQ
jgi:hypothetical protein